jgi:hypothetical protein
VVSDASAPISDFTALNAGYLGLKRDAAADVVALRRAIGEKVRDLPIGSSQPVRKD